MKYSVLLSLVRLKRFLTFVCLALDLGPKSEVSISVRQKRSTGKTKSNFLARQFFGGKITFLEKPAHANRLQIANACIMFIKQTIRNMGLPPGTHSIRLLKTIVAVLFFGDSNAEIDAKWIYRIVKPNK